MNWICMSIWFYVRGVKIPVVNCGSYRKTKGLGVLAGIWIYMYMKLYKGQNSLLMIFLKCIIKSTLKGMYVVNKTSLAIQITNIEVKLYDTQKAVTNLNLQCWWIFLIAGGPELLILEEWLYLWLLCLKFSFVIKIKINSYIKLSIFITS